MLSYIGFHAIENNKKEICEKGIVLFTYLFLYFNVIGISGLTESYGNVTSSFRLIGLCLYRLFFNRIRTVLAVPLLSIVI